MWSTTGTEASTCRDGLDLAEYTEELADEWKREHNYRLQESVQLLGRRCERT